MSSSPIFEGTSAHPSDCNPTARVFIDGVEVPTVNGNDGEPPAVEVTMRKTGVSDLTRVADVHSPFTWNQDDVIGEVSDPTDGDGFRSFGNEPVRIDILDEVIDEYVNVFHGPIASVGPSTLNGAFRVFATDWANYFENVGIGIDKAEFNARQTIQEVISRLEEHDGLPSFEMGGDIRNEGQGITSATSNLNVSGDGITKEFDEYKHNCADVLNWLCGKDIARWYVEYDTETNTPRIIYDALDSFDKVVNADLEDRLLTGINLRDEGEVGDVRVLQNNALFQISPAYSLGVRGKVKGGEVPEVIVEHEELADRAGTNNAPTFIETDATSIAEAENDAKSRLKTRIDDASGGEIVALPAPFARPYATIEAQPACGGQLEQSLNMVEYEVDECIHTIKSPTQANNEGSRTLIRCGIKCTTDDLSVREKRMLNP